MEPLKLLREQIEEIERKHFPHWFETDQIPIQRKPDWLTNLWENCVNY